MSWLILCICYIYPTQSFIPTEREYRSTLAQNTQIHTNLAKYITTINLLLTTPDIFHHRHYPTIGSSPRFKSKTGRH